MQTETTTSLMKQYQNKVNNAQGHLFEDMIVSACRIYSADRIAEISKTPEPFRVMKKMANGVFTGRFTSRALPDFQGTLCDGRSIVFEAKYTTTDRISQSVVTETQGESLQKHHEKGAIAAVCIGIRDQFFFVPWYVWRDMKRNFGRKYATADDLARWRVKFNGAVLFLEFCEDGGKIYEK